MGEIAAPLTDIAINLTDPVFQRDLPELLQRARQAGVTRMLVTASDLAQAYEAQQLCQRFPEQLWSTAGVHPHHARGWQQGDEQRLRLLLKHPHVCALGECGLDFNRDFSPRPQQQQVFECQLALAADTGLPVLMHERDAHATFVELVSRYRPGLSGAVLHCFTGSAAELQRYLELDLYIGITGWICDERRGQHLVPLLHQIPPERLLLETDSPYLLPRSLRPKPKSRRNEPAHLRHIAEFVAAALQMPVERLAQQTSANARRLFRPDRTCGAHPAPAETGPAPRR